MGQAVCRPPKVTAASTKARSAMPVCVMSITLRRSSTSATTPLTSDRTMIGTTRTRPTNPSASPFCPGATSKEICQRIATFCIIEPHIEINCPSQSSRKLRYRSAMKDELRSFMLRLVQESTHNVCSSCLCPSNLWGCNHYIPSHQERKLLWHHVVVTRHHASQELPRNDYSTPSTVLA